MSVYNYRALNKEGASVAGMVQASSRFEAEEKIKKLQLEVVALDPKLPFIDKVIRQFSFNRVSTWEKSSAYRQISTMVKGGVSLVRALQVVGQTDNVAFQKVLASIVKDVRSGKPFSTACAKFPKFFDSVEIHLLESGEATGTIDKILLKLADEKEKEADLRKKISSAMVYPILVVLVIIGVIILMMTKVVPVFKEIFAGTNHTLPIATRMLIGFSDFFNHFWWLVLVLLIPLIILCVFYVRSTKVGKYAWSLIKLRLPIFGKLHQDIILSEFCSTFAMLISSGVPIIQSIRLTSGVAANEIYRKSFEKIAVQLEKGVPISASLESFNRVFPPILINMVNAGEESGTIDQMLITLGHYYDSEADYKVKMLSSSIEPLLIIILGLGVAFVVFAVMIPLYTLTSFYAEE